IISSGPDRHGSFFGVQWFRSPSAPRSAGRPLSEPRMATTLAPTTEPIPGYRLIERLGRGGVGEGWKCEGPRRLLKAIKLVYGNLEESGAGDNKAAEQEKKALERIKQIRHPFLLSLERYDVVDGQLMIVMELADRSLWDRFRECRSGGLPGIPRDEL